MIGDMRIDTWQDPIRYEMGIRFSVPGCKPIEHRLTEEQVENMRDNRSLQMHISILAYQARVIFFPNDHPVRWWYD